MRGRWLLAAVLAQTSSAAETMVAPVYAQSPSIAWRDDRFGVLLRRSSPTPGNMLLLLDKEGTQIGPETALPLPNGVGSDPIIAASPAAWAGGWCMGVPFGVWFATFDDAGSFLVPPFKVNTTQADGYGSLRLARDPGRWWITWAENYAVCCDGIGRAAIDDSGSIVVPSGQLLQTAYATNWPSWDSASAMLGIAWMTSVPTVNEWHGTNIDASGAVLGGETRISPGGPRRDFQGRLEASGGGFGFGCQSTADNVDYDLFFTQLDADMDPVFVGPPRAVTTGGAHVPGNLVWTGVAFVWPEQSGEFWFHRLTRAGEPLGTRKRLSTGARPSPTKTWPEAAMADTVVGVVWTDERLGVGEPSIWYQHVPLTELLVGGGAGAGNAAAVRSLSSYKGEPVLDFLPYGGAYGANVASGSVDATPLEEILTGPGPGAVYGPQVRGFTGGEEAIAKVSFYAYGTLKYGAHVACTDLDGDGMEEIMAGPGPGAVFGPHVRGFDYDGTAVRALGKVSFYAYFSLKHGAEVAGGDVDGDGYGEIATGPGPGPVFGAHLRGFDYDGTAVGAIPGINAFVLPSSHGLVVGAGDLTADGREELLAAGGPSPVAGSEVRAYGYQGSLTMTASVTPWTYAGGAHVAAGDMDLSPGEELAVTPGFLPANPGRTRLYAWTGTALQDLPVWDQDVYPGQGYGATCAVGNVGI